MQTKLTLNIQDKELIEKAKKFARSQNKSLSVLMENILRGLVGENHSETENKQHSETNQLVGAFKLKTQKEVDVDDLKWEYLKEKYGL